MYWNIFVHIHPKVITEPRRIARIGRVRTDDALIAMVSAQRLLKQLKIEVNSSCLVIQKDGVRNSLPEMFDSMKDKKETGVGTGWKQFRRRGKNTRKPKDSVGDFDDSIVEESI